MSTNGNEPGGIHARRIEAENVVAGIQIQGGVLPSDMVDNSSSLRKSCFG
jgi:hypothetical protein